MRPIFTETRLSSRTKRAVSLIATYFVLLLSFASHGARAAVTYVQGSSVNLDAQIQTFGVTFTEAQATGNLIIVAVGWLDDDATGVDVSSVSDTAGNTYARAVGPTTTTYGRQSIYYAKNIVAAAVNANTVTVTMDGLVRWPNVRIMEYSGLDTAAPLDAAAGNANVGDTGTSDVTLVTTHANDLLVATNYVASTTASGDPAYTQRMITDGGEIVQDKVVSVAGTYTSSAALSEAGWWVMQMVAFKAASGGGDTVAPTVPATITATAASSSAIGLTWGASTDNVGVTGYLVERCQGASCTNFTQIATPSSAAYSDTALSPSTTYRYRVRATDAATNLSGYSTIVAATTQAVPDTQAPSTPTGLTATAISGTQINLSWTASTDNVGVTGYRVERCQGSGCSSFAQIGTPTGPTFSDTGLSASTTYRYRVRASDAVPNLSAYSGVADATTTSGSGVAGGVTYQYDSFGRLKQVTVVPQ